jgi:hypothetical protein
MIVNSVAEPGTIHAHAVSNVLFHAAPRALHIVQLGGPKGKTHECNLRPATARAPVLLGRQLPPV